MQEYVLYTKSMTTSKKAEKFKIDNQTAFITVQPTDSIPKGLRVYETEDGEHFIAVKVAKSLLVTNLATEESVTVDLSMDAEAKTLRAQNAQLVIIKALSEEFKTDFFRLTEIAVDKADDVSYNVKQSRFVKKAANTSIFN